jgi:O-antigen/teichoic acid export membrane protein
MSAGTEPGAVSTRSPAIRAGLTAILDQFLFVGASTLMVFLLGRALSANEYGGFVIAYTTFLLLGQAQTALFAEPMTVFAPSRYQARADDYVRAVERLNLRMGLLAAAAFVVSAGLMAATGHRPSAWAFLGAGIAAPPLLALWLRRRTLYLQGRIGRSVAASALFLAVGVAGVVALYRIGMLGAFSGMVALGAASLVGLLASRPPRVPHAPDPPGIVHAHWEYGRWSLLTALLGWCGNLYYFLLPLWHGLESAAELRALMNFVYPVIQANQALTLLLLPRWAAHDSRAGFSRSLSRLAGLWTIFSLALCGGALLAGPAVVHWVYAGRYDSVAMLLPWVFLLVLPDGICYVIANGLRASRAPRSVALAAIALPVVAVLPGVPLTYLWGPRGAVVALLLASVTQLALVWRGWKQPEAGAGVQT